MCTIKYSVCVCVCLSVLWVISHLPESHRAKSSAMRFIVCFVFMPQGKQQLFINNPPGGRERAVLQNLNNRANSSTYGCFKVLDCRLDWAQLERTLMAFFTHCVHALTSFLLLEWRKNLPWTFVFSGAQMQEAKGLTLGVFIVIVEVFVWACSLPSTFWTMLCFPENRLRTHFN